MHNEGDIPDQDYIMKIGPDNPDFYYIRGPVYTPRSEIEISRDTPEDYRKILFECYDRGWIKAIANVRKSELFWDKFHD